MRIYIVAYKVELHLGTWAYYYYVPSEFFHSLHEAIDAAKEDQYILRMQLGTKGYEIIEKE